MEWTVFTFMLMIDMANTVFVTNFLVSEVEHLA